MRVVLCPNPFRDCLDAAAVAAAMRIGVARAAPEVVFDSLPLADGGDGSAAAVIRYVAPEIVATTAPDAQGVLGPARWLRWGDCAFIETAETCGLSRLTRRGAALAPAASSTFGVGVLIAQAIAAGARTIYVGAGGSASIDAGAGALIALGAELRDARGQLLGPTPRGLHGVAAIDTDKLAARLAGVRLIVLSDVEIPLGGNVAAFGRQKGVTDADAPVIDAALAGLDRLARARGRALLATPWLGAGGGLAGGLAAFAGAHVQSGADWFLGLSGFDARVRDAALVLTGEGTFDASSTAGKLPFAVAVRAAKLGVASGVITGRITGGREALPATTALRALNAAPASAAHDIADAACAIAVDRLVLGHHADHADHAEPAGHGAAA